jgi:hypothetical protein
MKVNDCFLRLYRTSRAVLADDDFHWKVASWLTHTWFLVGLPLAVGNFFGLGNNQFAFGQAWLRPVFICIFVAPVLYSLTVLALQQLVAMCDALASKFSHPKR